MGPDLWTRAQPDGLRNPDMGSGLGARKTWPGIEQTITLRYLVTEPAVAIEHVAFAAIRPQRPGQLPLRMKLVSIPANPVPENAVAGTLKTPDGVSLRFARWAPPPGRKGTVCIFPGRAEFIEKYFEIVRDLRARGFAVAMLDWRGQGLSDRGAVRSPQGPRARFLSTTASISTPSWNDVVLPDCPPPLYALGHSMGGAILRDRLSRRAGAGSIASCCSAPMIALAGAARHASRGRCAQVMRLLGRGSASYVPGGGAHRRSHAAHFRRQCADLRSGALMRARPRFSKPSRRSASARRRSAGLDAAFRRCANSPIRASGEPHAPADADGRGRARSSRLDAGDRELRHAACCAGSHLILAGQPPRDSDGAGSIIASSSGRRSTPSCRARRCSKFSR